MGSRYYPRERNQRERLAETAPRAEPMNRRTEKPKGDWKIRRYWTADAKPGEKLALEELSSGRTGPEGRVRGTNRE